MVRPNVLRGVTPFSIPALRRPGELMPAVSRPRVEKGGVIAWVLSSASSSSPRPYRQFMRDHMRLRGDPDRAVLSGA